jgi:hypothetical protein
MEKPFLKSLDESDLYTRRKETKRGLGDFVQPNVAITQDYEDLNNLDIPNKVEKLNLNNDKPPELPAKRNSVKKRYFNLLLLDDS